jgi:hemolysin activation/secretion protein
MMHSVTLAFLFGIITMPLFGYGADDASRPTPPPGSRPSERVVQDEAATAGAAMAGQDQILLPSLKGIAIAPTAEQALKLQGKSARGVNLEGFTDQESAEIQRIAGRVIGRPVSLRSLNRLSRELEVGFRSLGRPFMQVTFPGQEITSGVIAIMICPARAGRISMSGKPSFGREFIANSFRTLPGEEVAADRIIEDMNWINENPLRRGTISYREGNSPEILDLTLRIRSPKPWRAYAGIDSQLSEGLGNERLFFGYQYGDLFSLDHRITGQYTSALDPSRLQGFSAIYEIPLPIRHLLGITLGYTESESDTAGPLDQSGKFSRAALSYRVPLPRWREIVQEWRFGMEFSGNDYELSNGTFQGVNMFQIASGWKGRRLDRLGMTRLDASLVYTPGQGILGSTDADYSALGADGAESLIAKFEMERTLKVADLGFLVGRLQGQWADSILLSSDQISAGGVSRVRGFDEAVGYASKGLVGTLEMQFKGLPTPAYGDFQAITFIDGAILSRDVAGDPGQLASVGVGMRWRYEENLSAKLDFGIPIEHPETMDDDPMLYFSVMTNW